MEFEVSGQIYVHQYECQYGCYKRYSHTISEEQVREWYTQLERGEVAEEAAQCSECGQSQAEENDYLCAACRAVLSAQEEIIEAELAEQRKQQSVDEWRREIMQRAYDSVVKLPK